MQWLQKGATTFFVLALSSLIFFVLTSDKQTRQQVLRPTLEALGEQLFAAVQDDVGKERLQAKYQIFVDEAEQQAIAPERVEKVAAGILNLHSRDSLISSADALKLLEETHAAPAEAGSAVPGPARGGDHAAVGFKIERIPPAPWSKEEMARRLKAMQELQKQMEVLAREQKRHPDWERPYHFQPSDSGLRVTVDARLRDVLTGSDSVLVVQLHDLEKKRWLRWGGSMPPPPPDGHGDSLRNAMDPAAWAAWGDRIARAYSDSALLHKLQRRRAAEAAQDIRIRIMTTRPDSTRAVQP